jgi:hypothetical protein
MEYKEFNELELKLNNTSELEDVSIIISLLSKHSANKVFLRTVKQTITNFNVIDNNINPLITVKVGDKEHKLTTEELEEYRKIFELAMSDKDFKIFTDDKINISSSKEEPNQKKELTEEEEILEEKIRLENLKRDMEFVVSKKVRTVDKNLHPHFSNVDKQQERAISSFGLTEEARKLKLEEERKNIPQKIESLEPIFHHDIDDEDLNEAEAINIELKTQVLEDIEKNKDKNKEVSSYHKYEPAPNDVAEYMKRIKEKQEKAINSIDIYFQQRKQDSESPACAGETD